MPTVPRLDSQQVQTQAMPNARVNVDAPIEAFGGGNAAAGIASASNDLAQQAFKIAQVEKGKADDTATMEAYTKLAKKKQELLYDPNNGALNKRGKDAFGVNEEYGGQFNKYADEVENGLANDDQKAMFKKMRTREGQELDDVLQKHTWGEAQAHEKSVFEATNQTMRDDAVLSFHDPKAVAQKIEQQKAILNHRADQMGMGNEDDRKQFIASELSKTHLGVTERLVNNNMSGRALEYIADNKEAFGADYAKVEKFVKDANDKDLGRAKADEAFQKNIDDRKAGYAALADIKDTALYDEARQRLDRLYNDQKQYKSENEEKLYNNATNIVEKYKDFDKIPQSIVSQLSLSERNGLRNYADALRAGKKIETDVAVYYDLKTLASVNKNEFIKTNLNRYRGSFSDSDFKGMVDLQTQLREGKGDKALDGWRTNDAIVNSAMKAKRIRNEDDRNRAAMMVDQEVMERQKITGKPVDNAELYEILDHVLGKTVTDKGWLFDTETPNFKLDQSIRITDKERENAIKAIKALGHQPTPEAIYKTVKEKRATDKAGK